MRAINPGFILVPFINYTDLETIGRIDCAVVLKTRLDNYINNIVYAIDRILRFNYLRVNVNKIINYTEVLRS